MNVLYSMWVGAEIQTASVDAGFAFPSVPVTVAVCFAVSPRLLE